ncbi:MAG: heparinase II/III family protein, partial [Victivallales bacterium]|nr:heparinase II/III family protein [Victivallales bacterium]
VALSLIGTSHSLQAAAPLLPKKLHFTQYPRIVYTPSELEKFRESRGKASVRKRIVAKGDALLKKKIDIPKNPKGGQWTFYYACPKDGSGLRALSKTKHKCPKCGKIYTNERIVAAYRTRLYGIVDSAIYNLALAYAVTGEDKYAVPVREAFLELVDLYPKLQRHDRWGRTGFMAVVGGKRYCQHLSEAVSIMKLAKAYDLCVNSHVFAETDRKRIEDDFLKATVYEISKYEFFVGRSNNHQSWFNAAYANVGLAIGDRWLIDRALNGPGGLLQQLKTSVTDDGIWYEGTVSYHFYALSAIIETLKALKRLGIDLSKNKRLESLWIGPMDLTFPNGKMPAINDGDPYDIKRKKSVYKFALEYFKNPLFANLAGVKNAKPRQLESKVLGDIGIAVLRRGAGKNAVCAFLDYGRHGDHHGHPDKLQLILYALKRELFLDPGRISYSVKEYNAWCRTTIAHNTVVLNETSQKPARGTLPFFENTKDYTACLAQCNTAYSGVSMKRFLLMTDTFMVDIFQVSKGRWLWGNAPTWDWLLHSRGKLTTNLPTAPRSEPLGINDGYEYLKDLKAVSGHPEFPSFDFKLKNKRFLRAFLPAETGNIFLGFGTGTRTTEKVPFILRRRKGRRQTFFTVYDFSGNGKAVDKIEILPVHDSTGAVRTDSAGIAVVNAGNEKTLIAVDLSGKHSASKRLVNDTPFERLLFKKNLKTKTSPRHPLPRGDIQKSGRKKGDMD